MKYLLDTDAFSDIVRGDTNVEWRFSRTPLSVIGMWSVMDQRLVVGHSLSPAPPAQPASSCPAPPSDHGTPPR
jgi:hypothetical protein